MSDNQKTEKLFLKITRSFPVAQEVIFDTFTKPAAMRVWWPEKTTFDIDLRVGGRWTIVRKEANTTYTATGAYLEVEHPHRLQYTYAMPQFSPKSDIITIDIESDGKGGSTMTFVESGPDIAEELAALNPGDISESEKEWQRLFDLMKTVTK